MSMLSAAINCNRMDLAAHALTLAAVRTLMREEKPDGGKKKPNLKPQKSKP
jgi:hypothetical protein